MGRKWSVPSERHGIPIGWVIDGANCHDVRLLESNLAAVDQTGLLADIGMLHLDRGYDSGAVRQCLSAAEIAEFDLQLRRTNVSGAKKQPIRLGLRWIVQAINSWSSTYGQLRRNTSERSRHRHTAPARPAAAIQQNLPEHRLDASRTARTNAARSVERCARAAGWCSIQLGRPLASVTLGQARLRTRISARARPGRRSRDEADRNAGHG